MTSQSHETPFSILLKLKDLTENISTNREANQIDRVPLFSNLAVGWSHQWLGPLGEEAEKKSFQILMGNITDVLMGNISDVLMGNITDLLMGNITGAHGCSEIKVR